MKRAWLTIIFVLVFIGTLIGTMPLSFVLERAGLSRAGLNWQHAAGTVFNGEITGLSLGTQFLGTLHLSFKPRALLGGQLGFEARLDGPAITGTADISFRRNGADIADLNGAARIDKLAYLAGDVRALGGEIEVSSMDADLNLAELACIRASGEVRSDMLERIARDLADQQASDLTGKIGCRSGALTLSMAGIASQSDPVTVNGELSAKDRSWVEVQVSTFDAVLGAGLDLYGFEQTGDVYIMRQEIVKIGDLING